MRTTRVLTLLVLMSLASLKVVTAATIDFQFTASLQTGALAGTDFTGTASYNNQGVTGTGTEYLLLTSLDFSLLGYPFTLADVDQGGQAILQNGTLEYFTAAFFPESSTAPVNDLAFGFGGPEIIGYSTAPGFNPGMGTYAITQASPEPSSLALCGISLFATLLIYWTSLRKMAVRETNAPCRSPDGTSLKFSSTIQALP